MTHKNAPLTPEGRKRLVERCRTRPIAHVAAEMGIPRATASKWVTRYRKFGELGLLDRFPHRLRAPRERNPSQPAHDHPAPDTARIEPPPVHRPERRDEPGGQDDRCQASRSHDPPGREEGRAHPRRRRLARARQDSPEAKAAARAKTRGGASRLRVPALRDRRAHAPGKHRAARERAGSHRRRILESRPRLVRQARDREDRADHHRQWLLLPLQSVRGCPGWCRASADEAVHAQAQQRVLRFQAQYGRGCIDNCPGRTVASPELELVT
ncbi:helix-turn-helix domain-containing protein [Arthrobacter sp. GN70]|uniref:Insertion element IS150 protein InsJ-like helix-turn-helix domain-containing protein n=1 Tax=Arthrobacter terricola TaxID=2547396 RepID=A0A4R5K6W1_9MICC|nr:helix-turn-helix domain-containing protein [Arthrobacter sp. GN70]TDF89392.1 hypothetical protein E1809_23010 [Arthrobacter terricola]